MKNIINIKKAIDILLESSYQNKDSDKFKIIFEELSKDENLQLLYFCINNLQNPPLMEESEVEDFINENIKLASTINLKNIEKINNISKVNLSEMDTAIQTVLFEERNAINFVEFNKSKKLIHENIIKKIKTPNINLEEFDPKDVQFIKEYIDNPKEKYEEICNDCLSILNEKLTDETLDADTKFLIYETKTKILENQINCKFSPENVIDILNLKKNLINN